MTTFVSHRFTRQFQANQIHQPRDFQPLPETFWQSSPIVLEIGAGKGKHAIQFAQNQPHQTLIAIERTKTKFFAMQKQAELANLSNLLLVHADAIAWIVSAVPVASLSQVFILYPNPEPNNANQRWLNMPFFEFLLSRLQENGRIVLASNIESYIHEAEKQAKNCWQISVSKSQVARNSQRTHFEIKYLARGEICWQLDMIKPQGYKTYFDEY